MHRTIFAPRDKEQRMSALLDAANAVFAERGFDCATTREIAERAGCAEGLIHRYFAGKRGLLLAILDHKSRAVADEFARDLPLATTIEEEIEQLLRHDLERKWERRDFMRVCVSQAAIDPEVAAAVRCNVQQRQAAAIAARLRAHKDAGRIRDDVDTDALAEAISGLGFAAGFMLRVGFGLPQADTEKIIHEAAAALGRGVSTTQQEGPTQ